jgi:hypothetical protein
MFGETVGTAFLYFASLAIVLAILFILSAILFVCLIIVGCEQKNFGTTFKGRSFSSGTDLLEIFPVCGCYIGLVWNFVARITGGRETHEIATGRMALAVFLPSIFYSGCVAMVFFIALPQIID